jgi:hypothetical protein
LQAVDNQRAVKMAPDVSYIVQHVAIQRVTENSALSSKELNKKKYNVRENSMSAPSIANINQLANPTRTKANHSKRKM